MSRFAALAGIGRASFFGGGLNTQDPTKARDFPRVIIRGPSGNCVSVPMMSGGGGGDQPRSYDELHTINQTFAQTALAWTRNEIVMMTKNTTGLTIGGEFAHAWMPTPRPSGEGRRTNDSIFDFENNQGMRNFNMFDGFNWKIWNWSANSRNDNWGVKRMPGGEVFWTGFVEAFKVPRNYGAYEGLDPVRRGTNNPGISGWLPLGGAIGTANLEENYTPHYQGAPGGELLLGGIFHRGTDIDGLETGVNDMAFFKDTIYVVTQWGGVFWKFGGKGNYLWTESMMEDTRVGDPTESSYQSGRLTDDLTEGAKGRCLVVHNDELFMLSNDGKVHVIRPDTLRQVADLTDLGTFSASGIDGGAMSRMAGGYGGTTFRRCFITSYNNQLHAFLNFKSTFNVAKGSRGTTTGRGVFWGTSFDGRHWTDQSPNLPTSGIHSPSGGGVTAGNPNIQSINWQTFTSPYRFSGFTGQSVSDVPNASGAYPDGYGTQGIGAFNVLNGIQPAQPSGFIQTHLPLWTSGNLLETANKPFGQMTVPLIVGTTSGNLYPTSVVYPFEFSFQDPFVGGPLPEVSGGVFLPSGVGPSGFDYTGSENFHISGYVDDQKNILELSFTVDAHGGGTQFFELNRTSGWIQRNHLVHSKQTNGYIPIMLYDPEITIPSGSLEDPNPFIDESNKTISLKYKLYDWPFWDTVDVVSEYSLNYGQNWFTIKRQKNLSTGSQEIDPSGVKGVTQTLTWDYSNEGTPALNKNEFFPHVQIRLTAIDPDFNPKELSS